jgi:hypothetical protein
MRTNAIGTGLVHEGLAVAGTFSDPFSIKAAVEGRVVTEHRLEVALEDVVDADGVSLTEGRSLAGCGLPRLCATWPWAVSGSRYP